jgi:hypothetical protein
VEHSQVAFVELIAIYGVDGQIPIVLDALERLLLIAVHV